jgi:ribosomal protein L11 methyltransferase
LWATVPWLEVSIHVPRRHAPLAESLLCAQGALSVTFLDDSGFDILEPGVGETPMWPDVCVTGLFPGDTDVQPVLQVISLLPGSGQPHRTRSRRLEDQDWTRVWMDHFQPMRFGRELWIVPVGHTAPEPDATIVRLDPGLAFGTGTHPTTRLCLEWLDAMDCRGLTVLDYGCGSGVLGIAAALKGASRVICVDNDPQALVACTDNARRNGVADLVLTLEPGDPRISGADMVLANILAGPLVSLAPLLLSAAVPGASFALSGILTEQAAEVAAAYAPRAGSISRREHEGWVRLDGKWTAAWNADKDGAEKD